MMTESNNLLYHPNDAAFDRLDEMEGGVLTRYPVLRSVPVPAPRPWSTRGAIALLTVCGVVFGVIAAVSVGGASNSSDSITTEGQASANIGGASMMDGSGSIGATIVVSGSLEHDDSNLDSSEGESIENSSDSALDDEYASSAASTTEGSEEAWFRSNFSSNSSSSFEDVIANPFENSTIDSPLDSSDKSRSESQSASADSMQTVLASGSDSASLDTWLDGSLDDTGSDDDGSAADWGSLSSSTSALSSQSEDSTRF